MSLWATALKELGFRKAVSLTAILAVTVAVASAVAVLSLLRAHETVARERAAVRERETLERMEALQDAIHEAMAGLGFNVSLVPEGQDLGNWLSAEYGAERIPVEQAARLKAGRLQTLDRLVAQWRQAMEWPEKRWRVIVVGTEGRIPGQERAEQRGTVRRIASGSVWLGHEIWRGQDVKEGDSFVFAGREFRVERCLPQEGSRDDITVWMPLADAQALFDEPGAVNEIAAVATRAAWSDADAIAEEVARFAPGLRAVVNAPRMAATLRARLSAEREALAMTRLEDATQAHLRRTRARLAWLLTGLLATIGFAWIGLLAYGNVRARSVEAALWTALGLSRWRLVLLYAAKWAVLGMIGAALGAALGLAVYGAVHGRFGSGALAFHADIVLLVPIAAALAATMAGGIPVRGLAGKDPSTILREDTT